MMEDSPPFMVSLVRPDRRNEVVEQDKNMESLFVKRKTGKRKQQQDSLKQKKKLSRREIKELGLYTIPPDTVKYDDAVPLHKMWCGYIASFFTSKQIPDVTDPKYNTVVSCLLKADYVGAKIHIVRSKQPSVVGMKGIVVLDTKGTFKMVSKDNKLRTIPKNDSQFEVILKDKVVTIFGKHLNARPAERSVRKTKLFAFPDL